MEQEIKIFLEKGLEDNLKGQWNPENKIRFCPGIYKFEEEKRIALLELCKTKCHSILRQENYLKVQKSLNVWQSRCLLTVMLLSVADNVNLIMKTKIKSITSGLSWKH
jgi:hypothetical protein